MERADNLELAIDMGWFWFLAQPMVFVMDFINGKPCNLEVDLSAALGKLNQYESLPTTKM